MTTDDLEKRLEALEMSQDMMLLILIRTSPNPQLIIDTAKLIAETSEEEGNPLTPLARKSILSLAESAENMLKNKGKK